MAQSLVYTLERAFWYALSGLGGVDDGSKPLTDLIRLATLTLQDKYVQANAGGSGSVTFGNVIPAAAFGMSSDNGSGTNSAHDNHQHGTPALPSIAAQGGATPTDISNAVTADQANQVRLTGNQTKLGKLIFGDTIPEVVADATTANQVVRKSQLDGAVGTTGYSMQVLISGAMTVSNLIPQGVRADADFTLDAIVASCSGWPTGADLQLLIRKRPVGSTTTTDVTAFANTTILDGTRWRAKTGLNLNINEGDTFYFYCLQTGVDNPGADIRISLLPLGAAVPTPTAAPAVPTISRVDWTPNGPVINWASIPAGSVGMGVFRELIQIALIEDGTLNFQDTDAGVNSGSAYNYTLESYNDYAASAKSTAVIGRVPDKFYSFTGALNDPPGPVWTVTNGSAGGGGVVQQGNGWLRFTSGATGGFNINDTYKALINDIAARALPMRLRFRYRQQNSSDGSMRGGLQAYVMSDSAFITDFTQIKATNLNYRAGYKKASAPQVGGGSFQTITGPTTWPGGALAANQDVMTEYYWFINSGNLALEIREWTGNVDSRPSAPTYQNLNIISMASLTATGVVGFTVEGPSQAVKAIHEIKDVEVYYG